MVVEPFICGVEKMKALFVIPPSPDKRKIIRLIDCSHETKASYLLQPNDFMIISSLFASSDEIAFVDGTADSLSEKEFFGQIEKTDNVSLIFFAFSSVCWSSDLAYFRQVKNIFKGVPVFVIGDSFLEKAYQDIILKECRGVIYKPHMAEPKKLLEISNNQFLEIDGVITSPKDKLFEKKQGFVAFDKDSFPRHEVFLKKGYRFPFAKHYKFATVTTTWGCPFNCSYCPDSLITPLVRPYQTIIKELEYIKNLNVKELFFADKSFGFPSENVFGLLKEMSEKFNFSWSCYHHAQLYTPELLELMKKAGCHTIILGVESFNTDSMSQFNRNVKKNKIEELVYHASKLNMNICADFIIGLEHESEEDILKTIKYSQKLPIDFASFNIFTPVIGLDAREKAIKENKINAESEGFDSLGNKSVMSSGQVSSEKLIELRKKAVKTFYFRPATIFRRLKKTDSIEYFFSQLEQMLELLKKGT